VPPLPRERNFWGANFLDLFCRVGARQKAESGRVLETPICLSNSLHLHFINDHNAPTSLNRDNDSFNPVMFFGYAKGRVIGDSRSEMRLLYCRYAERFAEITSTRDRSFRETLSNFTNGCSWDIATRVGMNESPRR
jgi:hypothetical protein